MLNETSEDYMTGEGQMEFDEVAIYFSKEEWCCLNEEQKQLYRDVMMENYYILKSLGIVHVKPSLVSRIEQGEEPYVCGCHIITQEEEFLINDRDGSLYWNISESQEDAITWFKVCNKVSESDLNCAEIEHNNSDCSIQGYKDIFHTKQNMFKCLDHFGIHDKTSQLVPSTCSAYEDLFAPRVNHFQPEINDAKVRLLPCPECGKCFTHLSNLIAHQKTHSIKKPFSCSECGKCFTWQSNLINHQKIHKGERPFLCSECGKCFTWQSSLIIHQKIHAGVKPFSCIECGKSFTCQSNLATHQKIHKGEKPFLCPDCGKCFTWQTSLIRHQKIHTGEKPFTCSTCGKCFNRQSNLITHQNIHTGEKTYSCTVCGKGFASQSSLIKHEKVHTGEKPYSCSDCGKCFTQQSSLGKHRKIHTGVKPFSCSDCRKSFIQRSDLLRHEKTHLNYMKCFVLQ
ncbi:zinc finger protein 501 isoform X2 [Bombina bombina]|uniref:zinc finger protein 501 isoform X2 n=1 Tax=Bombina bombina TaxID=8345 RepID=UPI00235B13A0|nr:zinc finger protein 501 isoform X2 [Bombina bombina]